MDLYETLTMAGGECEDLRLEMEAMDARIGSLSDEITSLETLVRHGDKQAYRSLKIQRLRLAKMRQERSELSRRGRRLSRAA